MRVCDRDPCKCHSTHPNGQSEERFYTQCPQCASSGTPDHNGANGHRFVFHQTEISHTERRYVRGEPDIIRVHPPQNSDELYATPGWAAQDSGYGDWEENHPVSGYEYDFEEQNDEDDGVSFKSPSPAVSPSTSLGRIITSSSSGQFHPPGTSFLDISPTNSSSSIDPPPQTPPPARPLVSSQNHTPHSPMLPRTTVPPSPTPRTPQRPTRPSQSMFHLLSSSPPFDRHPGHTHTFWNHRTPSPRVRTRTRPATQPETTRLSRRASELPQLRHGDVVWWHNLKRAGDIAGVSEEFAKLHWRELEDDRMWRLRKSLKALR